MEVKALIFDLDDTLYDQSTQVTPRAIQEVLRALVANGLPTTVQELNTIVEKHSTPHFAVLLAALIDQFSLPELERKKFTKIGFTAYDDDTLLEGITPFPEVHAILQKLHESYKLILITTGSEVHQGKKLDVMDLRKYFDLIIIDSKLGKEQKILYALKQLSIKPRECLCIGDRIDNEIKAGNTIGLTTIRLLRGKYSVLKPKHHLERPDYEIQDHSELPEIIEKIRQENLYLQKAPKIVVIGGGTGLPFVLKGLKQYTSNLTAIVTVTDSGRSSGILRKEHGVLPPGDIRNNLIALSDAEDLLINLFQYRFTEGQLQGHTLGNLLLVGLTKMTGSFEEAIVQAGKLLNVRGRVMPSTLDDIHVCVTREDGSQACSEDEVVQRFSTSRHPSPIKDVYLNPKSPRAYPPAVKAILDADFIIIGPGSLYTSIITNLLIPDIAQALRETKAKKMYVCNIVTQPFQTDDFTASHHLSVVQEAIGAPVDFALFNVKSPDLHILHKYEQENSYLVKVDLDALEKMNTTPILADLLGDLDYPASTNEFWHKRNLLRHDPLKLAEQIIYIVDSHIVDSRLEQLSSHK
jgi:uncharacterized cofD-like protein/HAD superfamily hydrolase (TIGR01509 family)